MAKIPGLYIIGDVTSGKSYVGSTVDLQRRFKEHGRDLDNNDHDNRHLQNSFNAGHQFVALAMPLPPGTDPIPLEQQLLDEYFDSGTLLNISRDATAFMKGIKHSEETKEKQRLASTGVYPTEEVRQRLSEAAKARGMPRSVIEAGAASRVGKKLSPEHIEKVRQTSKERMTPEARANLSAKNLGIPHTPETIALMKEKCKGRVPSEATKVGVQRYHAERRARIAEEALANVATAST